MRFRNRADAGRALAGRLRQYAGRPNVVVLALPRGGVPVAAEVAEALGAPLDVFLVRKLGVPGHEELAFGALAEGGTRVLHQSLVRDLGLSPAAIDQVTARERAALDRHDRLYREGRAAPGVRDQVVILVDDGLATGATMEAAVMALKRQAPASVVVAVPVGARDSCDRLARHADEVVCALTPEPFNAVGLWYDDFSPTSDEEVRAVLARATRRPPPRGEARANPGSAGTRPGGDGAAVRDRVRAFGDNAADDNELLDALGQARVVLLGESTHGTHEFYRQRALLTRRLISERGFAAVAVEADWPDAYRVNRFVRGIGSDQDAIDALADFRRFPAWMWRNADVLDLVGWMREYNEGRPAERRAGFYGLDLYSLHASMRAVLAYLDKIDPAAAARARARYACFDRFGPEPQDYAYLTGLGLTPSCERDVVAQLVELRRRAAGYVSRDGRVAAEEFFLAEQNARVVRDAEEYYRTMMGGRVESWNLRDRHMFGTLEALLAFLDATQADARVVVWAHNSHLGDARATDMGRAGELNVGQLARERFGAAAALVGFTSYAGTVTAAAAWDGPALRRHLRPGLAGSYERLFHDTGVPRFVAPIRADATLASLLGRQRLERAVGVVYLPESERQSHYFRATLSEQFDFVLHLDHTRAVEPLERTVGWEEGEMAETYPSGL